MADTAGHRIQRINTDGTITTLGGSTQGWSDGLASEARFNAPSGVAILRDGGIVVADTANNRIRAISPDGVVTTLAGNGSAGYKDGEGASARFHTPIGIALTALGDVLVADTGNNRIRRIDRTGRVSTLVGGDAGYVDGDLSAARFNGPLDVALDLYGRAFVADSRNHAIRVINFSTGAVRTLAGNGEAGDAEGLAGAVRFNLPSGICVDGGGVVYVADAGNSAVRRLTPEGQVATLARIHGVSPADVAVGPAGDLYLSDPVGHRILSAK